MEDAYGSIGEWSNSLFWFSATASTRTRPTSTAASSSSSFIRLMSWWTWSTASCVVLSTVTTAVVSRRWQVCGGQEERNPQWDHQMLGAPAPQSFFSGHRRFLDSLQCLRHGPQDTITIHHFHAEELVSATFIHCSMRSEQQLLVSNWLTGNGDARRATNVNFPSTRNNWCQA